jgi:hypothetical protein
MLLFFASLVFMTTYTSIYSSLKLASRVMYLFFECYYQ